MASVVVFWLAWTLLAGLVCLWIAQQPGLVDLQTNADQLLAISLIWDLQRDYGWRGFQLPRIPSLLPVLLTQAVLHRDGALRCPTADRPR